jgi:hypothetical protein
MHPSPAVCDCWSTGSALTTATVVAGRVGANRCPTSAIVVRPLQVRMYVHGTAAPPPCRWVDTPAPWCWLCRPLKAPRVQLRPVLLAPLKPHESIFAQREYLTATGVLPTVVPMLEAADAAREPSCLPPPSPVRGAGGVPSLAPGGGSPQRCADEGVCVVCRACRPQQGAGLLCACGGGPGGSSSQPAGAGVGGGRAQPLPAAGALPRTPASDWQGALGARGGGERGRGASYTHTRMHLC